MDDYLYSAYKEKCLAIARCDYLSKHKVTKPYQSILLNPHDTRKRQDSIFSQDNLRK